MLITFTHAYRPCWLANTIELCTKQTRNRVCVTHPLAVYKTARCSLILTNKSLVRTRYVQFTYFMGRVYWITLFRIKALLIKFKKRRHLTMLFPGPTNWRHIKLDILIDVKFVSERIFILVLPIHRCVLATCILSTFPSSVKIKSQAYYLTFAITTEVAR